MPLNKEWGVPEVVERHKFWYNKPNTNPGIFILGPGDPRCQKDILMFNLKEENLLRELIRF